MNIAAIVLVALALELYFTQKQYLDQAQGKP
jgi:hypothetical protein